MKRSDKMVALGLWIMAFVVGYLCNNVMSVVWYAVGVLIIWTALKFYAWVMSRREETK